MNTAIRRHRRSAARVMAVLLVLVATLSPTMRAPAVAAQGAGDAEALDLPAMALTPVALADAGQEGYLLLSGRSVGHVGGGSLAYSIGRWTDQVTDDDIRATLEDAGLGRGYQFGLRLRQDLADPRSDLARDLYGWLHEFADEDGAADAFDLLDNLSAESELVERVEGEEEVGDATALVRVAPGDDSETRQLVIAFQAGPVIAVLQILDYQGEEPAVAEAETLGALLLERIEAGFDGDWPGLGSRVPRLISDEYHDLYEVRLDQYLRLDGEDIPFSLEEPDAFAARVEAAGDATDVYGLNQFVQNAETDPPVPDQFNWGSRLYGFADDEAAADWLAAQPERLAAESGDGVEISELEALADAPIFGDESAAFTYIEDDGDGFPSRVVRVQARLGATVADVRLSSFAEEEPPIAAFEALASDQLLCLAEGCSNPVTISDALEGRMAPGSRGAPDVADILDLPAMTLTPAELDDEGLVGYGLGFGETTFPDQVVASTAELRGLDEDEVTEILADAGFVRRYDSYLYLPEDEDDPTGPATRLVASYVLEFADEEGAEIAFEFLEDESESETAEDLEDAEEFGDRSEVTADSGEEPAGGGEYAQLDLTIRLGSLHLGVAIVDWSGEEPDLADVEALGERLLERAEDVLDEGGPGLGSQVVRLVGDEVVSAADYYLILDGDAVALSGDSRRDLRAREEAAADLDQTDAYRLWQQLYASPDDTADDVWYLAELIRFTDEDAASEWLAGSEERVTTSDSYENGEMVEDVPAVGDEVVGYTYAFGDAHFRGLAVRVGTTVALLDVYGPETPPAAVLDALAEAQAACLEDGGCLPPLDLPEDLEDFVADVDDAGRKDDDDSDRDEDGRDDAGAGTYESALYGFTLTYDPDVWQLTPEDDPADDAYEWIALSNGVSTVWLVGDPDYASDELSDCVEFYLVDQGFDDGSWEAEPIDDLVEEDGRAYATYSLEDPLFGLTGYLYLECQAIGDGATLVVIHFAGTDEGDEDGVPADEVAAVEELLTGLEVTGAENEGDQGDEGDDAAGVNGETYVSPTWGYTVTWDPESWVATDEAREDGIEFHIMGSVIVMAVVEGVADYDGDPEACLSGMVEAAEGDTPLTASDELPAPATADEAVGGVYELGDFAVLYFECRTLVPGEAVLQVRFAAPVDAYEDALPALAELLAGIEVA